jgi:D-glycero-alpha-D-manno-heptose-7-phosphate kinase
MIISRTPFRVSFFGGGTDYPGWYMENGGAVIGGAIDKYCYISLRSSSPFFGYRHRIVYSNIELVQETADIRHPAVRAIFQEMNVVEGLEVHHDGDLPARSGLGSSSSFTVGLLNALHAYRGAMTSCDRLARQAIHIEQNVICENVGSQDQVWAAYGGLNRIDFHTDGAVGVKPLILPQDRRDELERNIVLIFTGLSRYASDIAGDKIANLGKHASQLRSLRQMVDEAENIITAPDRPITDLGGLLHDSWRLKRELSAKVSNAAIDDLYAAALREGALGGKLLGAGGGGFLLLLLPPERQGAFRERMKDVVMVPLRFDRGGSKIVLYEPDDFHGRPQA